MTKLISTAFIFGIIVFLAVTSKAQAPAQTTAAKVGLINTETFSASTGGVTRLVNAIKAVDAEFKPRRDEITQLIARLNSLQQIPAGTPQAQIAQRRDQAKTLQIEIQRKQEDARAAYTKRMATQTNPIRQSIFTALEAFAKQRGVDVLIDISKYPVGVLLVNQTADMTPAFIRDFNSKNP